MASRQPSTCKLILFLGVLPFLHGLAGAAAENPLDWWSLRPLSHATPPSLNSLPEFRREGAIDRFVFAKLAEKQLTPSRPADRRSLIRRVTFDLLGLPPTPEEVESFVKDSSPEAYERLVDRLLASPPYGERWGRHWLDVIRFGESRGFERNEIITTAWPFRDYVIRSFNEDKPFNQFVLEHLAGDQIGRDQPDVEVGAAFLVAGPYDDVGNQDAVQARIIRANTVDDIITATGAAFLGLTVNCARCHNHKFDPVSMEDYYRMYATFAGVIHGERPLATAAQRTARAEIVKPLEERVGRAEKALADFEAEVLRRTEAVAAAVPDATPLRPPVNVYLTEDEFPPVEARYVRLTVLSNNRDPRNASGARIDELEVWSASDPSQNLALASTGAKIEAPARRAEDFADAYGPDLMIDGAYGAKWIADRVAPVTVTLARPARLRRVSFSGDRGKALPANSGENTFVGEYTLEVSSDRTSWTRVADSRDRVAINAAFARERQLQRTLIAAERERRDALQKNLADAKSELRLVPPLAVVWAGRFEQPKEATCVLKGGDPTRRGEEVQPGSPSTLRQVAAGYELPKDAPEGERRLALARWLVREDNPLTARVLANRVWHYHFGVGIVDTPSDFGKQGGWPTHPELLDWLARRLHFHGWRLKPLHREILLSQTYRQSADWRAAAAAVDADSRFLWRFPPRRLSAEEIRDTMLSVAGVLDKRMGGPGFRLFRYLQDNVATYLPLDQHGPETYRRSVYHHTARASRVDLMTDFDSPDCAFAAPRRAATSSPLQALTLLNHSFTLDMARAMARRLEQEATPGTTEGRIEHAFRLAYGRAPSSRDISIAVPLIEAHGLAAFCRAILNSSEFLYVE